MGLHFPTCVDGCGSTNFQPEHPATMTVGYQLALAEAQQLPACARKEQNQTYAHHTNHTHKKIKPKHTNQQLASPLLVHAERADSGGSREAHASMRVLAAVSHGACFPHADSQGGGPTCRLCTWI